MNTAIDSRNTRKAQTPEVLGDRFSALARAMTDRFFEKRCATAFVVVSRHDISEVIEIAMKIGRMMGSVEGARETATALATAVDKATRRP